MRTSSDRQRFRSFRVGGWLIDPSRSRAVRQGHSVHIEAKPMRVMSYLAERSGRVVLKDSIFREVWNDTFVTDDALTKCISELRKALQDNTRPPQIIQTVHKVGYSIISPVTFAEPEKDYKYVIAVLPFDHLTGEDRHAYISDGLAEEVAAQLGRLDPKRLAVIARTSMEA